MSYGEEQADQDWHVGCEPEWEYDPEGWASRDDDYRSDYEYEWQRREDQ